MASTNAQVATQHWPKLPATVTLSNAADALLNSDNEALMYTVLVIDPGGASRVLTSTPTLPDGGPGRDMVLVNKDSSFYVGLQDRSVLASSNLCLGGYGRVLIGPNRSLRFTFDATLSLWLLEGSPETSFPETIAAFGGGGQGSATVIRCPQTIVGTVASVADSVKMTPTQELGAKYWIFNTTANAMNLYPESGGQINVGGANVAISVAAHTGVVLTSTTAANWSST